MVNSILLLMIATHNTDSKIIRLAQIENGKKKTWEKRNNRKWIDTQTVGVWRVVINNFHNRLAPFREAAREINTFFSSLWMEKLLKMFTDRVVAFEICKNLFSFIFIKIAQWQTMFFLYWALHTSIITFTVGLSVSFVSFLNHHWWIFFFFHVFCWTHLDGETLTLSFAALWFPKKFLA